MQIVILTAVITWVYNVMRRTFMKRIVYGLCLVILLVSACGRSRDEAALAANERVAATSGAVFGAEVDSSVSMKGEQAGDLPAPSAPEAAQLPPERLQVRNANMSVEVANLAKIEDAIHEEVRLVGGYIASARIFESTGLFVCKIPQEKFDGFIEKIETMGAVKNKEISAEDVTNQFYDLENRIKNRRILLERYRSYLARAATTNDLINIEHTINNLMTEIDSLEGSMKNLSNQISYSTLTLSVQLPPGQGSVFTLPSFIGGLRGAGEFFLIFLYYLVIVFLYILAIGIPLLLLAGLVYFVGFGRIGLILKFFRALGPKGK
ncbi:MAG: DUF4349 domain-containing protein [Spirochaetaceae bacterium]|nr:MAG: DUF4349 domain-containing protein [Spirochaetaceae bacterium]